MAVLTTDQAAGSFRQQHQAWKLPNVWVPELQCCLLLLQRDIEAAISKACLSLSALVASSKAGILQEPLSKLASYKL